MNARLTRMVASLSCLACLAPAAVGQPDTKPDKQTVKADDGVGIVVESRGKGDTALVFLHGWGGSRDYWKNQVEVFAADYRVVALDQAGHGESGKDRKAWTVDALGADAAAVVKALGLKRVILVGHSMGGPVALAAAKRLPGTVVAVVGVDTLQNAEFKMPAETLKQFLDGFEKDFKGTVAAGFGGMFAEKSDPAVKKAAIDRAAAMDPKLATALMRDLQDRDDKKLLKEAEVPVRCVNSGGGYQWFQPTDIKVNKKYADFDAVIIDDVGHYPMLEKPAEFNRKLRDVLKEFAQK